MLEFLTRRRDADPMADGARRVRLHSRRGSLGAVSAIGVVVVVSALSLATDPAVSHEAERRTRAAVQSGALAGVAALRDGGDAVGVAAEVLARNGGTGASDPPRTRVEINTPPQSGAYSGRADAVEVVLVRTQPIGMAHVAIGMPLPMRIRAVAVLDAAETSCPLAPGPIRCVANEAVALLPAPRLVE